MRGKRPSEEIDHGDGKNSEDQRKDAKVSFRMGKRIIKVGKKKKEGRMKVGRIFFVKLKLSFEAISRIVESVNLVHPQGLFIKCVKPQGEAYEQTEDQDEDFSLSCPVFTRKMAVHDLASFSCNAKDGDTKRKRKKSQ